MSHRYEFVILFTFGVLQLCTSAIVSRSITFNDTTQFQDISLYNFADGLDKTYEFLVTARTGKLVSLYLFQNDIEMQYQLDAYDGKTDRASKLQTNLAMPTTEYLLLTPINVTSTGQNMFIRVKLARTNPNIPDFQAMVTDYSPQAGCYFPGFSINVKANYSTSYSLPQNADGNCLYVLHANDPMNAPSVIQKIFPKVPGQGLNSVAVYKGLYTDRNHLLDTSSQKTSLWAYDSYLVIKPYESAEILFGWDNIVYRDKTNTLNMQLPVVTRIENDLMTMDYLREPNPNFVYSQSSKITLNVIDPATKVEVIFLRLGLSGSITVTTFANGNSSEQTTSYGDRFRPMRFTYECEKVELMYINFDPTNNEDGFYGTYKDATNTTTTTTTTVQSIQTTTNRVRDSFCFFSSLIVTFVLILLGEYKH